MLKILELFGGIGACSKALDNLGIEYEISDYVEIDKYAVNSYNAIHNTNFIPQDITKWDKDINVDLIMRGSPCQDFSLAGRQAGGDEGSGTRSSLLYETIRIVEKLKPKYVIWENVKNLVSDKHIHNFNNYIKRMDDLGYNSYWEILNAKDYGIPQNRERVFTVSIRKDIAKYFVFPLPIKLDKSIGDLLEDDVDSKYYLSDRAIQGRLNTSYSKYKLDNNIINNKAIHPTILARFEGAPTLYVDANSKIRRLTPKECWRLMGFDDLAFSKAAKVNSDSQLYKQAGNSIVVNVLMAILKELL